MRAERDGGVAVDYAEDKMKKSVSERIVPPIGEQLTEEDYKALNLSWINREIADVAMLRRVDDYAASDALGRCGKAGFAGILIPYYWPDSPSMVGYRIRRDSPDWRFGKDGKPKQHGKYMGPPNSGNRLYIPAGVLTEWLQDIASSIVIVEGEKKALALWRLANHDAGAPRFIPIAIPGVWSWRGRIAKSHGPDGKPIEINGPINDLGKVSWHGRKVVIIFDTNVQTLTGVSSARKALARELTIRGAEVDFIDLPVDCRVNGIDDLLAGWGPERVLDLFKNPTPSARLEVKQPPGFEARPNGMFRLTTNGERISEVQLTTFSAEIISTTLLDDGVETKSQFEIAAQLMGRKSHFTIPASDFANMNWPIEKLGPPAIIYPNQREYARTAIQWASQGAVEKRTYTHTGWRDMDGCWQYLNAGGAIGSNGLVPGVAVRLNGALKCYELRLASDIDVLRIAIKASLKLTGLAPAPISFPLLAATYRSVFGEADFALHVSGRTGTFKSELAALCQQHFGSAMHRLNLPGAWSATANALEMLAFHAKDALLVIDDFAPSGSSAELARHHATADRLFRATGNLAGRSRLDSTATLREPKPPRALILSTGEEIPRGHSIRARMIILEPGVGSVDSNHLQECQEDAKSGKYAESMGGFVMWFARNKDLRQADFTEKVLACRQQARGAGGHARTPDIIVNLQSGFEMFLEFSHEMGAIDREMKNSLASRCWEALRESARSQAKYLSAAEPTVQYMSLLSSVLSSGRAHLEARSGGVPERSPESCGWRKDSSERMAPMGEAIGWVENDDVYLEPASAFRVVQLAGRDIGEQIAVSESTLRKRLHENKLLASVEQARDTLTVRKRIGGCYRRVLHFHRNTILPEVPEG